MKLQLPTGTELGNIAQYGQILPNIAQYGQLLSNIAQYFKNTPVLLNIAQVTISAHSCLSCDVVRNIQITNIV